MSTRPNAIESNGGWCVISNELMRITVKGVARIRIVCLNRVARWLYIVDTNAERGLRLAEQ